MQTKPCPERFVQQLQRNCSPEVLYQGLSDFFLSCILQCVVRCQESLAKPKLLTLQFRGDLAFQGLKSQSSLSALHSYEGCMGRWKSTSSNLYCETEQSILNFEFYYLKEISLKHAGPLYIQLLLLYGLVAAFPFFSIQLHTVAILFHHV